ncbi:hypothetical protein L9F63_000125, partial [Diploptera punctata]
IMGIEDMSVYTLNPVYYITRLKALGFKVPRKMLERYDKISNLKFEIKFRTNE